MKLFQRIAKWWTEKEQLRRECESVAVLQEQLRTTDDALRAAGERNQELRLQIGEDKEREERFLRTIDTLNENLRERLAEVADLNTALAAAQAELARSRRPVLFTRGDGMPEERRRAVLAGRRDNEQVQAILDLLDECSVVAMSENASRPTEAFSDGKTFVPGFTTRDREFCGGGVWALTEFKRRVLELIEPRQDQKAA